MTAENRTYDKCRHCGQDIYETGDGRWRDDRGQRRCLDIMPGNHAPVDR